MNDASSFSNFRNRIRTALRDACATLWDDAVLDEIIDEAQREYALVTGTLTGEFTVVASEDGVFDLPGDFIEPLAFVTPDGWERPLFSWRHLHDRYPDFRAVTGTEALGVICDFESSGKSRIFPRLPAGAIAGTLRYRRTPVPGIIETNNLDALEHHCLWQAFLLNDSNSAAIHYEQFLRAAARECSRIIGVGAINSTRSGVFF